jgi:hypothetical protein
MIPVAGKVYTLEGRGLHGGGYEDSADMPQPFGIRIIRQAKKTKNPHSGARVFYDVVGAHKPRRRREGSMLLATFQRRVMRELTDEQAERLERGERISATAE